MAFRVTHGLVPALAPTGGKRPRTTASSTMNSDDGEMVGNARSSENFGQKFDRGMARTCDLLRITDDAVKET